MLYDVSLRELFYRAEKGEIRAIQELWERYNDGVGVPQSAIKAREWKEKILENPDYAKQFFVRYEAVYVVVGNYYYNEKRYAKAFEFYVKAKKIILENHPSEEHQERIDFLNLEKEINSFPQFSHLL